MSEIDSIREISRESIQSVLMANERLLRENSISVAGQVADLRSRGVIISGNGISMSKNGKFYGLSIMWLTVFSFYWNKPIEELISEGRALLAEKRSLGLDVLSGHGSRARRKKSTFVSSIK